jgi:hypothetical protein
MSRRFVVAVDGLTDKEDTLFRKYIAEIRAGFWHWIPNFWLLITDNSNVNAEKIASKLNDIAYHSRNLVIEIPEDIDWQGWGIPNARGDSMFEWLSTTWANKD